MINAPGAAPPNGLMKPQGGDGNFNVASHVQSNWEQANAQHKQLLQAVKRMNVARAQLEEMKKLGDGIQVEDVIKGAGSMVGAGFSPQALAQLLAQMPTTGGQGLAAWVDQQAQRAEQMDQQLQEKVMASSVHRGMSAMAALHIDHIKGQHMGTMGAMPQGGMAPIGGALAPQQSGGEANQASSPALAGEGA